MQTLLKVFGITLVLLTAQAYAQTSTQDFVTKVAISDMFEIESSKMAEQKGNSAIKSFAQRMVKDHTKTSQELKALVGNAKVKLPTSLDVDHQAKIAKLQKLTGGDFNTAYAQMQVEAHQEAVKLFEAYSLAGDSDQLKAWATKTLPALKEHLDHARKLK